jgi:HK97 family phage major capsid protein
MTLLEILQERQQVHAEILDLRGKRSTDGKFADAATETHFQKASQRFNELTNLKAQAEIDEAQDKQMAAAELEARQRTPANTSTTSDATLTYDSAFWRYMARDKDAPVDPEVRRMLDTREARGTSTQIGTTNSLGGYTIPISFSNQLELMMKWYGGMLGNVGEYNDTIGGPLHWPSLDDTAQTGAIIAQGVGTTVNDLTFGEVLFGEYTIDSKVIKVSLELAQDNRVGLLQRILGDILPQRLGRIVNTKLTNGTGTGEPYGLTTTVTQSAGTSGSATAITQAELIKIIHSIDKAYRQGPKVAWMMSDTIMAYIRTMDIANTNTNHLFYPSLVGGEPDKLAGYPIVINNDLPAAHATTGLPVTATKPIYFGDFSKYVVRKINDINMSRNDSLYWAERSVGFMGWMRLDGNLVNAKAIKSWLQA